MTITNLWNESVLKLKNNFSEYKFYYFLFVMISLLDLSLDFIIPKNLEQLKLILNLSVFFLTVIASILFLRTQKRDAVKNDFWYLLIPFLLYSIYYSVLALLGLFLFFLPGIIFYYVPLIGAFDEASAFKMSFKMAKQNFKLTAFLAISALLLELIPLGLHLIPNIFWQNLLASFFSLLDAYIYMILMIMTVKYYYAFKDDQRSSLG